MKKLMGLVAMMVLLLSCGGRKQLSPEELQHRLDSVKALEIKEKLESQGIQLEGSDNPLKMFYDSLNVQPLPITYAEDYVKYLPDFRPVPHEIVTYLNFEGRNPKAISLPESLGAKLILLAADESPKDKDKYSLWIYSLDDEYMPVDKLCLYALEDEEDQVEINPEQYIQFFSITSDYEIRLMDYAKEGYETHLNEVYHIGASRKFVLSSSDEEE